MPEPTSVAVDQRERVKGLLGLVVLVGLFGWLATGVVHRMNLAVPVDRQFRDFYEFYCGSQAMLRGEDIYVAGKIGYIYPPLLAFLMMPLAGLPIASAGLVWLGLKLGLLGAILYLGAHECVHRLGIKPGGWMIACIGALGALLLADKLRAEMNMQQSNLLMLLSWLVGIRYLDRRPWLAGLALGFGANIKYVTLLSVPYMLVRGRFKAAGATLVGTLGWAMLPAMWLGWDRNIAYLEGAVLGLGRMGTHSTELVGQAGQVGQVGHLAGVANVLKLQSVGLSLPRCFSILTGGGLYSPSVLGMLAIAGVMFVGLIWWAYRLHGQNLFGGRWGKHEAQPKRRALVLIEWVGLIVIALAFGPQTNGPHTSQMLLMTLLGATLLLAPAGRLRELPRDYRIARRWVMASMAVLVLGFTLPPGSASTRHLVQGWHDVAGPSWCMLIAAVLMTMGMLHWVAAGLGGKAGSGGSSGSCKTGDCEQV